MFAKAYFDNGTKCIARWLDLLATDRRAAWEYHARGIELIAMAAKIKGLSEAELRGAAFKKAIYM